jgi:hypothetical protein
VGEGLGCSAGLAVPPLEAFGGFISTRARVSPGLGLAPALLLGCALPLMLSSWLIRSVSLAYLPPLGGHHSAGLLPTCVWEAPACLGDVHDVFPPSLCWQLPRVWLLSSTIFCSHL